MDISIATPALLFPAVSLLMLAYTNKALSLANLIRSLHAQYKQSHDGAVASQIKGLRFRLGLIRNMQALAVGSMLSCVLAMLSFMFEYQLFGRYLFVASLLLLASSLVITIMEIQMQNNALNVALSDIESPVPLRQG